MGLTLQVVNRKNGSVRELYVSSRGGYIDPMGSEGTPLTTLGPDEFVRCKKRIELHEKTVLADPYAVCRVCARPWDSQAKPVCTEGCEGSSNPPYWYGKVDLKLFQRWADAGYEIVYQKTTTGETVVLGDPTDTQEFRTWADAEGQANYEAHQMGTLFERAKALSEHLFPEGAPFGYRAEDGLPLPSALGLLILGAEPSAPFEDKIWHAQMIHRRIELEHLLLEMSEETAE